MLQFITNESDRYSIAEEVEMVLEGGCRWIQLRMKNASDEEVRAAALEIIPMCRENGAFLIIDDRVELVSELKVSGVHLGKQDMDPLKARELLGPHAVIGITANSSADILKFKGKDVDYVGLGPCRFTTTKKNLAPEIGIESYRHILNEVRTEGMDIPIVAIGGITDAHVKPLMDCGINGHAVSGAIINASDPVEYTRQLMESLKSYRYC